MKFKKHVSTKFFISLSVIIIGCLSLFNYYLSSSMLKKNNSMSNKLSSGLFNIFLGSLALGLVLTAASMLLITVFSNENKKINTASDNQQENRYSSSESGKNQVSKNNLTEETIETAKNLSNFSVDINAAITEISSFADEQASLIEEFSAALEQVSTGIQLTAESTQQAALLVEVSKPEMDSMVKSVENIASVAQGLSKEADNSRVVAKDGEKVIQQAIAEMNKVLSKIKDVSDSINLLNNSTKQIGEIIDVINSISSQTNLLSLNASIEAARAGEYGKGFSVVARSIKELSEKSRNSTQTIYDIIKNIQEDIRETVNKSNEGLLEMESGIKLVQATGTSIDNIISAIDKTVEYSEVISKDTQTQFESSKEIYNAIDELNNVVQGISSTTLEQSAGIQQMVSNVTIITDSLTELAECTKEICASSDDITKNSKHLVELVSEL